MIGSEATPGTTVGGIHELRRRWQPAETPWAEVVIVHGLGEHSGRYERTGAVLAAEGLVVRSFDLIGCGATGGRRAWVDDWSQLLDQIEEHLTEARKDGLPVVLLGHSLGGLLATEYTLSERSKPDALVISAPALFGGAAWQRFLAPVLGSVAPRLRIPNNLRGDQLSRDPEVGEAYFADPLVQVKTSAKFGAEMFAAMERVSAALDRLSVPTLVIHGGADTIVPPTATAPLADRPGVERRLYPTLRHESFNEPEGPSVVREVADWIRTTVGPKG